MSPALLQVPRPRIQVRSPGPAGRGGPESPLYHGGRSLGREGGGRQPPPGADGGRPEEAAQSSAAAAHQRDPTLLHQPGDVFGPGSWGAEVWLSGPSFLQHPRRGRDFSCAQSEEPLQLRRSLRLEVCWFWTGLNNLSKWTLTGNQALTWALLLLVEKGFF